MVRIEQLMELCAKLPGLGPRSARRVVLYLMKHRQQVMLPMAQLLHEVAIQVDTCHICGNMDLIDPCHICADPTRRGGALCVVEGVSDLWAMERGRLFQGQYHVLGGTLSVMGGLGPEQLRVAELVERVVQYGIPEVILATNLTVEGETTAHYIAERLADLPVRVSRLAHGIPLGGELEYVDEGTLGLAFKGRRVVSQVV